MVVSGQFGDGREVVIPVHPPPLQGQGPSSNKDQCIALSAILHENDTSISPTFVTKKTAFILFYAF
jgi:hypothetical protein